MLITFCFFAIHFLFSDFGHLQGTQRFNLYFKQLHVSIKTRQFQEGLHQWNSVNWEGRGRKPELVRCSDVQRSQINSGDEHHKNVTQYVGWSQFRSSFECYMIQVWFIHDTFIMYFRYKLWQRNIFSFIFLDRSFDFRWILLMVSLSICYIYDTSLLHSWFLHDTFIRSLNENDSIVNEWTSNLFTLRIKQWVTFLMTFYVMFILRLWQVFSFLQFMGGQ